jgi:hypothetical protein
VAGAELDTAGVPSAAAPGGGTIPESAVIGRAFLVIWPPAQLKELPIPATFLPHQTGAAAAPQVAWAAGHRPPGDGYRGPRATAHGYILPAARAHPGLTRR